MFRNFMKRVSSPCVSDAYHIFVSFILVYEIGSFLFGTRTFFQNKSQPVSKLCSIGIVQVHTDKTATTSEANSIVAQSVHLMLPCLLKTLRLFLIFHELTLVGLLTVFISMLFYSQKKVNLALSKSLVSSSTVFLTHYLVQ